jgi:DNA (cytosine-5)-methyltransferase 1
LKKFGIIVKKKSEIMIKAIDFFCGAGGLTRGLLDAGIEVIMGIDFRGSCRETYEKNNPPARFKQCDLRNLSFTDLRREINGLPLKHLLFVACAPCQPFSKQRTEAKNKDQRTLLGYFTRIIEEFQPGFVLVENVPGIAKVKGNSTYKRFISTLNRLGYHYDSANLDAKNYGVPQTRRRHIVLASKLTRILIPEPTHGPERIPYVTVRMAIGHFPPIKAGDNHPLVPNHRASCLSALNLERLQNTPPDGGNRNDWPENLYLPCHRGKYKGHTDVYGRMWWDRPAPALTCKCHSLSNGRYGHPDQNRAISLREAAALQTFPENYIFYGSSKEEYGDQIGNAVPVRLAKEIGRSIITSAFLSDH